MAIHLVTGKAGTDHVKSENAGSLNAGIIGLGTYFLETGTQLAATMINANTVRITDGDLSMQGRHVTIEDGDHEDLAVENGTQQQLRHDLVVVRYEKLAQSPNTEKVTLKVIKGTPADSDPQDPEYEAGDIRGGDLVAEEPIWRIPLDGISVGEPERMCATVKPLASYQAVSLVGHGTATFSGNCTGAVEVWAYDVGDGSLMVQAMCNANHGAYISFRAAGAYNAVALTLPEGYYVPGIYFDTPLFAQNSDLSASCQISSAGELLIILSCSRSASGYGMSSRCLMFRPGLDLGLRN